MILLTPMAPASNVPKPTIQVRMLTPASRLSIMLNMASMSNIITACLSVGLM